MLKIMIRDTSVAERKVPTKQGSFTVHEQAGWVEFPSGERRKIRVSLPRGVSDGYPQGDYLVGPGSFAVNQWGDLELGRQLELIRAPAAAAARVAG